VRRQPLGAENAQGEVNVFELLAQFGVVQRRAQMFGPQRDPGAAKTFRCRSALSVRLMIGAASAGSPVPEPSRITFTPRAAAARMCA
jgi:hypothetical protein